MNPNITDIQASQTEADPDSERHEAPAEASATPTKKEQLLVLYEAGVHEIEELATLTGAQPSYVASVLQQEGLMTGYFDLYTSTGRSMNVYSKFFRGKLGFRDVETAERSVRLIGRMYRRFEENGDRSGQHHAMMMAMTMFNRARWTGKDAEADVFRAWLHRQLAPARPAASEARVATGVDDGNYRLPNAA